MLAKTHGANDDRRIFRVVLRIEGRDLFVAARAEIDESQVVACFLVFEFNIIQTEGAKHRYFPQVRLLYFLL
jgi:hypothetical protein